MSDLEIHEMSNHTVEMRYDDALVAVLDGLGIPWAVVKPNNGTAGTIKITLTGRIDGQLEQVIGLLSDLRWQYTPGRTLQLTLPRFDDDAS